MSLKIALILFAMNPDFSIQEHVVRSWEGPQASQSCMAMYVDRLSKQSHGDVAGIDAPELMFLGDGKDADYACRYLDGDKIMGPNFDPPGTVNAGINVIYPPYHRRPADIVIEYRGLGGGSHYWGDQWQALQDKYADQ